MVGALWGHLPVLQKHAVRILSQPCSTSLCERYELQRGKSDVHELKMKMMAKKKFSKLERDDLEAIDLNKLVGEYEDCADDGQYMIGQDESACCVLVDSLVNDPTFSLLDQTHIPALEQYQHQLMVKDMLHAVH